LIKKNHQESILVYIRVNYDLIISKENYDKTRKEVQREAGNQKRRWKLQNKNKTEYEVIDELSEKVEDLETEAIG